MPKDQWYVQKHGGVIPVSREVLLDAGAVEPTEAEKAEREEQRRQWDIRREEDRRNTAAWLERLAVAVTDPTVVAVLALHTHSGSGWYPSCEGCDVGGYEPDQPAWPCGTVRLIANLHGCSPPSWVAV